MDNYVTQDQKDFEPFGRLMESRISARKTVAQDSGRYGAIVNGSPIGRARGKWHLLEASVQQSAHTTHIALCT